MDVSLLASTILGTGGRASTAVAAEVASEENGKSERQDVKKYRRAYRCVPPLSSPFATYS
jgi:hypothetical protein